MVDERALHDALASGHLSGAVLDTYDVEPLPAASPLLRLDSVTVTPHIAGASTTTVKVAARHGRGGSAAAPRVGAGHQCGGLTAELSENRSSID